MILEVLLSQIDQRFQHEKRAQVCLWFDEKQEFARLLPALLRAHLAEMKEPPFLLLEYDAAKYHGQIWLKYRIYQELEASGPEACKRLRFVLYLPLSEDRLDGSGPDDEPPLELLTEYRVAGLTWRIGGKRPTLFTFLRQASVALPESPSEQRRLYEGGRNSLLAKYVAKFISMVSAILGKPVQDRTVVLGEMSVQGMLLKVTSLPERMQLAVEAGQV